MPSYNYQCQTCKKVIDKFNTISNHEDGGECCGNPRKQVLLAAPMIDDSFLGSTKNPGYHCVVSDRWIESKRARKNMMAEFDVVPKE